MKSFFRVFLFLFISACTNNAEEKDALNKSKSNKIVSEPLIRTFDYKSEKPVDGKLIAAIEIGSSGLNYFIVNMDDHDRWSLIKSGFGKSDLLDMKTDIESIFLKIESYKREIISAGVDKKDIYVIASSSAIETSDIEEIKSRLSISDIKLRSVSAKEEGYYDLLATIPVEFIKEGFLVDIGSGNTKITWAGDKDTVSMETFGSKYYLEKVHDTTAFRTVRDILLEIPIENRNLCFLLGGIPYEFASVTNKRDGRYTILEQPGKYSPSSMKAKSGKVIYSAIYLDPTYSYIFDWDANFSIGYLLSLKNR